MCRACGHETPVEATNICERCFGPLEVRYDYAEVARRISRESIAAGPPSIWRYRDLLPVDLEDTEPDHARRGIHAADPRAQPRRRARAAQPVPEERHAESDRVVQGPRRQRRRDLGARARAHHDRVRQHRQPRQLGGRVRGARGTARRRRRPERPRAREDDRDLDLPADAHRRRRQLRRRQPSLHASSPTASTGVSATSTCAPSTARAARRSPSRPPSSSGGGCPTRSSCRSHPAASSSSTARRPGS